MSESALCLSGINAVTGEPLVPPDGLSASAFLAESKHDRSLAGWFASRLATSDAPHWGLPLEVDPLDLSKAGWAVVFHESEPDSVRKAVAPLIEHRQRGAGPGVLVLEYRSGEDWRSWLARHGVELGSVLPHRVPYYVLLAGSPRQIPFDFQALLSTEYAVGRLSFDQPEGYRAYAESVIAYETETGVPNQREVVFFAPRQDKATEILSKALAVPLADGIPERWGFPGRRLLGPEATRSHLGEVLSPPRGERPPALLFTASHGMGFPAGHAAQRDAQGALLCQDWPGRGRPIERGHYFAADDLPDDARLHGLISFHFACYGAGTPDRDAFLHEPGKEPPVIAEEPFVARLPQRLLSHPQGGALAVIGHVERAWGFSFLGAWGPQRLPFENTLGALLQGWPAGHAVRDFRQRFKALSAELSEKLEHRRSGAQGMDEELEQLWKQRNDARNYAVLGDPAARLRVADLERREGKL